MQKKFTELVVSGSFDLVKGFILGFRCGSGMEFDYFFHHKSGIRRETIAEMVKELLELENYIHLCLENDFVERFKEAAAKVKPLIGLEVKKERRIKEARFNFSFSISNREAAQRVRETLANPPAGVHIEGYQPQEESHPEIENGSAGYAPLHPYLLKGQGTVTGEFGGVMELFLKSKRMPESELMLLDNITLTFED